MWDDVIIGDEPDDRICSANLIRDIKGGPDISGNSNSYWISDCVLGLGLRIYRSAPEAGRLKEMLVNKAPDEVIKTYLDGLVLSNVKRDVLLAKIERMQRDQFEAGRKHQARLIRDAIQY